MKTTSHSQPTAAQTADKTQPSFVQRHLGNLGLAMPGVLTLLAILSAGTAQAQTDYFWDPTSGDSVITEGSGNLDATTSNWTQDSGATNTTVAANDPFNYDLVFGTGTAGSTGTITVATDGLRYGSLDFRPANGGGSYDLDLNGNTLDLLRSAGTITVTADATISDSAGGGQLRIATNQFTGDSTLSISAVLADRTGTPGTFRTFSGVTLDLSGINTFAGPLQLNNSSQLVISGAGQLDTGAYAGAIEMLNNADFTYASSADQTLSGVISDDGTSNGSNEVNMSGSGTLTLTNANTYTGSTRITNGTLEFHDNDALGTGLVNLVDVGTPTLAFGVSGLDLSENVQISNQAGTRTIRLDLAGTATGTLSGQLDIRRATPGEFVMDVGADDTLTVSNAIVTNSAGGAGLTKEGDGELIIQANSSYTGITTVNGGTLEILATAGGNAPGTDSYQINNGSTLFLNETTASNLVLGVGRGDITFGSSLTGGTLSLDGNTIFRNQTITTTGGAKNFVSGDRFNLQNSRSIAFDTAVGTDGIDLEVSATISSGDIIKNGAGTVSLTNSANNLGLQGGATGDPNTVTINDGTLEIGGAGRLVLGNYAGAITNDGTFKYNSTNAQTLSGVISGNGAVVKDNSSTLTLSGANTYSGNTSVSGGILSLSAADNNIASSAAIDVASGDLGRFGYHQRICVGLRPDPLRCGNSAG